MGSDCHNSCLAGVKDRFGKTKVDTSDSKCGLSRSHVLCGFTLRPRSIRVTTYEKKRHEPFSKELKDLVLALLGKPYLP